MKSLLNNKRIALILLGLVTFFLINGEVSYAQWLSPGKLTKSHKELEGLKNCTKCHELGKGILNTACMSCHEKLVAQIKNNKGFHSKLKDTCISCHTDHKGENYNIISLDKDTFDHDTTDYKLKDKHKTSCEKCHRENKTYLGLKPECIGCHTDIHAKQLSGDCLQCHNFQEWEKANFDHAKSSEYKLTGKHKDVKCDQCHKGSVLGSEGKAGDIKKKYNALNFKPVNHNKCNDCHFDIHKGELKKQTCKDCHTTDGWEKKTFEHNNPALSDFRLEGKHENVSCELCHIEETFRYKQNGKTVERVARRLTSVKHENCNDCHYDVHKEQFREQRCDSCHTVENEWKKPEFRHDSKEYTGFKLAGRHKEVECKLCHEQKEFTYKEFKKKKKTTLGIFKPLKSEKCNDCHYDVHTEQFREQRCDSCHTVENEWKKFAFSHESEEYKGFKLEGRHKEVECKLCHEQKEFKYKEFNKKKKTTIGKFKPLKSETCNDCHYDVHKEQFRDKRCDSCHTVKNEWKKVEFSHESEEYTGYKLEGKHKEVECKKCHKQSEVKYVEFGKSKESLIGHFIPTENNTCSVCHEDKHKGQYKEACSNCHSPANWEPKKYLHDPLSLELKGGHKTLECIECHQGMKNFEELDSECVSCHQHQDPHLNQFGQFCDDCHRQQAWIPTDFKHTSVGFRLAGGHREADCMDCHINRDYRNTSTDCYDCHIEDYQSAPDHVSRQYPQQCERCHKVSGVWENVSYDHTAFTFMGAHNALRNECSTCHDAPEQMLAGTTDDDCYNCHTSTGVADTTYEEALAPSHTLLSFSTTCTDCHSVNAWAGASYTHQSLQLNGVHTTLDCTDCHASGYPGTYAGASQSDCYTCHQSDYDGAQNHTNFNYPQDCTTCHSGNSWEGAVFQHQNFQRNGVHASLDCTECHASGYPGDYAGASQGDCIICHQSDYDGASNHTNFNYPQDCTNCHSGNTWSGASYSHQSLNLNSLHSALTCTDCHTSGYPGDYAGASQGDCITCHQSDYDGALNHTNFNYPQDCTNCHSGNSWLNASFNHQSLNLNSLHQTLDCTACHASGYPGDYAGATQGDCYTCHQSDYNGALNHQAFNFPQDCTTCHSGNTWLGANYSHQSLNLNSLHSALACTDCHTSGYPGDYAGATQGDCYTCHQSDYNGALNHQSFNYPQDCTTCHSGNTWLNASFNHQSLNLNSLHSALACTDCHASGYPGDYAGATQGDCYTCHQSDYNGALNHQAFNFPQDCTTCHSGNTWLGASYSHQSLNLNSLHSALTCTDCHTSGYPGDYAGASQGDCYTCHVSDYNGALNHQNFNYPQDCTNCHSGNTWQGATFQHQSFQLRGRHTSLNCNACHSSGYPGNYAGTSDDDCFACHQSDYNDKHSTCPHDCTECHNLNNWGNPDEDRRDQLNCD